MNGGDMQDDPIHPGYQVSWSSDLTKLADALLEQLDQTGDDPFGKHCIVVNSDATEKWLKQYFLLDRKTTRLLCDLEFAMLPEFVNDWLWATVEKRPPRERRAARHPYSRDVLTWRIYRILEGAKRGDGLDELLAYVGDDPNTAAAKRGELAEKLAVLYDDYLNCRFDILRQWEAGRAEVRSCDLPAWQYELYRKLTEENPGTYVAAYERAFAEPDGSRTAFADGFPKYLSVHVFDIPFIPEPTLKMLEKIAHTLPMKFWIFNPMDNWLAETPSRNETKRKLRRRILEALKNPDRDDTASDTLDDLNDEERLLGMTASGARGVIATLCEDSYGDIEVPGEGGYGETKEKLRLAEASSISVHSVYSPRRELEAVKDGLQDFFARNRDAAPHDALVLCADWDNYAPIIDMVFPPPSADGESGYIPVSTESIPGGSTVVSSFEELLKFRSNRFEVSAVFGLLDVPDIGGARGLDEDAVKVLRQLAREANIHWGLDDEDVNGILGPGHAARRDHYRFTWQRGFDRLTTGLLHGLDTADLMKNVGGEIGTLHPCGDVEDVRAEYAAALWAFVNDLAELRKKLPKGKKLAVPEIVAALRWVLATFYGENNDNRAAFGGIRRSIAAIAENMANAELDEVDGDVFIRAVLDSLNRRAPGRRDFADSVHFAPLNAYTATPRRFVWICGLNDGAFPHPDRRASYDALGIAHRFFDVSRREQDAFALLKAALCIKNDGVLALSYVGKNARTNKDIPPSVLLDDLTDYLKAADIGFNRYEHPLAGYSRRCFKKDGKLPPGYSAAYLEVAKRLAANGRAAEKTSPAFAVENGVAEITLDELAAFFTRPNRFLAEERLNARIPWVDRLDDSESLAARLGKPLRRKLALERLNDERKALAAELETETGRAPDPAAAFAKIQKIDPGRTVEIKRNRQVVYSCVDHDRRPLDLADTYRYFLQTSDENAKTLEIDVGGTTVRLSLSYQTVDLATSENGDGSAHTFLFADSTTYESARNEFRIRHLAVNAASPEGVTTLAFDPDGKIVGCRALTPDEAKDKLAGLLELALAGLPAEYSDLGRYSSRKDDTLPEEWQDELSEAVQFI